MVVPCSYFLYVMLMYVVAAAVLRWIDQRVVEALKAPLSERTVVRYSSQVTQFLLFVLWAYGSSPFLPVTDQVLCQYLVWQSMTVDPKNLGTYLSAIRNFHLALGLDSVYEGSRPVDSLCFRWGFKTLSPCNRRGRVPLLWAQFSSRGCYLRSPLRGRPDV